MNYNTTQFTNPYTWQQRVAPQQDASLQAMIATQAPASPVPSSLVTQAAQQLGRSNYNIQPNTAQNQQQLNSIAPATSLQGYNGQTNVDITGGQRAYIDLATQLANGSYGNLLQMLSGQTDQGLFQRGVVDPMQRQFQNTTIPGINEAFSGGAYGGANFWSGARGKAQAQAQNSLNDTLARLRYQDMQASKNQSLQAAQLLPALYGITQAEATQQAQNLERQIMVHYQNQGLSTQQLQNDLSRLTALLAMGDQDITAQTNSAQLNSGNLQALLGQVGNVNQANQMGLDQQNLSNVLQYRMNQGTL